MSLTFRWLGVAGIELKAGSQVLVLDPFLTRPSMLGMIKPVTTDASLIREKLPACNYVLVTHAHWDHLMDVPEVLQQTGAVAYGSANTCQLLSIQGVPAAQVREIKIGDSLHLGAFNVQVVAGRHSGIPFAGVFNGTLKPGIQPPLRLQDYRMDTCLGYCITVLGKRVLACAAEPQPADLLFMVAQEPGKYYMKMLKGVQPRVFVPIHWDNFLRPLSKPVKRFTRPGRMQLWQLTMLARKVLPRAEVIVPEIFREYTLEG